MSYSETWPRSCGFNQGSLSAELIPPPSLYLLPFPREIPRFTAPAGRVQKVCQSQACVLRRSLGRRCSNAGGRKTRFEVDIYTGLSLGCLDIIDGAGNDF